MRRFISTASAVLLVLSWAEPAAAQVNWSGVYVGPDFGLSIKQIDFTVTDSSPEGSTSVGTGRVSGMQAIGVYAGANFQLGKIVVGAELSVGDLGYDASAYYGVGSDTHGVTNGGFTWAAMGRAGFALDILMPYVGFGVTGAEHSSHVEDDCNTPPCGQTMGEGSGSTSVRHSLYAIGVELMVPGQFLNSTWTVRGEWVHTGQGAVVNVFERTVTGNGVLPGTTAIVEVNTPQPASMGRLLISIRFGRN